MDDKYTSIEFDCELSSSGMELLMKDHHWSNYFKAGLVSRDNEAQPRLICNTERNA